jgi:acetoacetate decarboxylase
VLEQLHNEVANALYMIEHRRREKQTLRDYVPFKLNLRQPLILVDLIELFAKLDV